jgi:hypothetical protein
MKSKVTSIWESMESISKRPLAFGKILIYWKFRPSQKMNLGSWWLADSIASTGLLWLPIETSKFVWSQQDARANWKWSCMKAEEFEKKFDEAKEDLLEDLELSTARRVNLEQKRINVDFPNWIVEALDREATRIGVTRQSIIKMWLVERLQLEASRP